MGAFAPKSVTKEELSGLPKLASITEAASTEAYIPGGASIKQERHKNKWVPSMAWIRTGPAGFEMAKAM